MDLKIRIKSLIRRDIDMSEIQNPYKLLLDPELTVFTEKPQDFATYHCRFEDNR
jgi:hypothetical protein